jgi:hypothetical protein
MNIVQTRGGPRDNGPPSVENLTGQHSVSIDLTLAPNVNIHTFYCLQLHFSS